MNQITHKLQATLPRSQRGVGTLLISLVILTTITFILIYSARTVLTETQLTRNDMNGRQAFEAAEAGQEAAAAYLSTPGGRDKDFDGGIDPGIYDTDGDGVGDSNTTNLANGAQVTVTLANVTPPVGITIMGTRVTTQGWNADRTAFRQVSQEYAFVTPLPNLPENPLLTRGQIVINGAATVINPEGHSTIWSGGEVDLGGNNTTSTMIADPSQTADGATTTAYPNCLGTRSLSGIDQCAVVRSSDRSTPGLDIVEQDTSLANLVGDDFFLNFFGMTPSEYQADAVTIETTPALSTQNSPVGANLAVDEVVWVDGGGPQWPEGENVAPENMNAVETSWNGLSVGCTVQGASNNAGMTCAGNILPSIIVVDGDLRVTGQITIWGLVYVTGDVRGAGTVNVMGAMMMQGTTGKVSGNVRVIYNSEVLRSTADNGPMGGAGGTWRDF